MAQEEIHRFKAYETATRTSTKRHPYCKDRRYKKFIYLLKDKNRQAKTKQEKSFIRKYSRKMRQSIHDRDHWKCRMCSKEGIFLHIHHLRYTTNPDDWVSICKECHDNIHQKRKV